MAIKACEICGGEFTVKPYRALTARFCSQACGGKWHMENRKMPNDHKIGNSYRKGLSPTNAFTSEQVSGENNPKWVPPIDLTCSMCERIFQTKPWILKQNKSVSGHRFCTDLCRVTFMRGENHPLYVGGPVTYRGRGWIEARKLAVARDKGVCQECSKYVGDSISVHHKIPYRTFSTPEKANQIENLICYCQSCHMKLEPPLRIEP